MVNPIFTLGLIAVAGIVFLSAGGVDRLKAFGEGLKFNGTGSVDVPTNQAGGGTIQIKKDSEGAVSRILSDSTSVSSVTQRRKGTTGVTGITSREKAAQSTLDKLRNTQPSTRGVAQFSTGQVSALSEAQKREISARALTQQQREDIIALDKRRASAIDRGIKSNLKLTGAELVLKKAFQEQQSKNLLTERFGSRTFVGGKLFAKEGFASGGLTPELAAQRAASQGATIGKEGQVIENLGAGGSAIIKSRTEARVAAALDFNRRVIAAKKAGAPLPTS